VRLLVTGGAGYIGTVLTRMLLDCGHEVVVLDDLCRGHADAVPRQATLLTHDLHDIADVVAEHPVDAVMHLAAKSVVGESVQQADAYWATNVEGTRALVEAMRGSGVRRLVVSSSAATYGSVDTDLITEDTPPAPTSPYGATKLAADAFLAEHAEAFGIAAVSLRYFNVAGAAYGLAERHDPETHLIPNALATVAGDAPTLTLYGDDYPTADGTCVRDDVHVADIARAHVLALTADLPPGHLVLNLGSGTGYSVREVLGTVARVTGREVPVTVAPRRPGDPPRLVASNARASDVLGWTPEHDLDEMVADAWAARTGGRR
jgi:UDP-glucose 4-epimerase